MSFGYWSLTVIAGIIALIWTAFFSGRMRENAKRLRAEEEAEVARRLAKKKQTEIEIYSRARGSKDDVIDRL